MNVQRTTLGGVLATELLAVRPVEYFVIVSDRSVQFIRVRGRDRIDLLLHRMAQDNTGQTFDAFCQELIRHPSFTGQPIKLLIDNDHAFTYIKRLDKVTPAQLFDKLTSIPKDNLETSQTTFAAGSSKIFVWQGIDRAYLDSIKQSISQTGLSVTDISTLAAHFLIGGLCPEPDQSAACLYRLSPNEQWYSIFTTKGDILFDRLPESITDSDPTNIFDQLTESYGLPSDTDVTMYDNTQDTKPQVTKSMRPVGELFRLGSRKQKTLRPLSHMTDSSRTTNILKVACNSARLLATIVVAATLLLAFAAGLTSIWSHSLAEPIDDFQHRYTAKLELSRQLDNLREQEAQLSATQGTPHQTAAVVSAFCQRSFNQLFLTQLTVQYAEDSQILVEALGAARRESTVFALHEHLAEQLEPHAVTVNSLKPQRSARGVPDSLFTFGLSVKIDE